MAISNFTIQQKYRYSAPSELPTIQFGFSSARIEKPHKLPSLTPQMPLKLRPSTSGRLNPSNGPRRLLKTAVILPVISALFSAESSLKPHPSPRSLGAAGAYHMMNAHEEVLGPAKFPQLVSPCGLQSLPSPPFFRILQPFPCHRSASTPHTPFVDRTVIPWIDDLLIPQISYSLIYPMVLGRYGFSQALTPGHWRRPTHYTATCL